MSLGPDNCTSSMKIGSSGVCMAQGPETSDMTKEDRKRVLLEFMSEYDLALPPKAIHRNIRYKWNATFGYSSVNNYLEEFVEDGLAVRVEPAPLESRELVEVGPDEARAYYLITDAGKEQASS